MVLSFQVVGVVHRDDASGIFVSKCPELDICSQGRTEDEAKIALEDALDLYVKHCVRRGILFDILTQRGIGVVEQPQQGDRSGGDAWDLDVRVPMGALVADAHLRGLVGTGPQSWRP